MKINGVNIDAYSGVEISGFDLEQAIFEAWHTSDDLKLIMRNLETMNEDQVFAAIHGAQIFAEARCQKLMDIYEQVLENGRIKDCEQGEQTTSFGQEKI